MKIGNVFNLSFTVLIIIGITILYFRKDNFSFSILFTLIGLLYLFLGLVLLINFINIPKREYFLLSLSFTQVLIISAFSFFQFILTFLLIFIWAKVIKLEKFILLRSFINSFFIAGGFLIFALVFINVQSFQKANLKRENSNVAVVLGAAVWSFDKPSPTLALRVDKAAKLYKSGKVNKIQLTGGNAPGEMSEAEVSLKYILEKGIPKDDIWVESKTTSTIEQIRFIKYELFGKRNISSAVVVSDGYHLQRVMEIARFYNLNIATEASELNLKNDNVIFYQMRECIALLLFWFFAL